MINAGTLDAARESKEILMNELGVIYVDPARARPGVRPGDADRIHVDPERGCPGVRPGDADREGDPALVSTTGTVEGGTFRFRAAHFEWLLRFGATLGLRFDDMGKRRHGDRSTLLFCDELFRLYGSDDYNEAMGASFAVENWAAAGFWKELIAGLEQVRAAHVPALPLAFFTWHDKLETNHRDHVWHELRGVLRRAVVRGRRVHRRRRRDAECGEGVLGRPVRGARGGRLAGSQRRGRRRGNRTLRGATDGNAEAPDPLWLRSQHRR